MKQVTLPNGTVVRYPQVAELVDLGVAPVAALDDGGLPITILGRYGFSIVESIGKSWCLCLVTGKDFTNLNADLEIRKVFEGDNLNLAQTPNQLGWNTVKKTRILNYLVTLGADMTGLDGDSPLWQFLRALGRVHRANFAGPAGTWVQDPDDPGA